MIIPLGHCGGVQDRLRHEEFATFRVNDAGDTWGAKNKHNLYLKILNS